MAFHIAMPSRSPASGQSPDAFGYHDQGTRAMFAFDGKSAGPDMFVRGHGIRSLRRFSLWVRR